MSAITEWRQRQVVEAVQDYLATGMEAAAHMVEVDARSRLLRIVEPAFGRAYRQLLALGRLTSGVVVEPGVAVEGLIGIPKGEKGGDYGFWIEIGSKSKAAQPWLRPALMNNLKDILRLLAGK
jgi:hypothetical protein